MAAQWSEIGPGPRAGALRRRPKPAHQRLSDFANLTSARGSTSKQEEKARHPPVPGRPADAGKGVGGAGGKEGNEAAVGRSVGRCSSWPAEIAYCTLPPSLCGKASIPGGCDDTTTTMRYIDKEGHGEGWLSIPTSGCRK
jgi:hypothetical protein